MTLAKGELLGASACVIGGSLGTCRHVRVQTLNWTIVDLTWMDFEFLSCCSQFSRSFFKKEVCVCDLPVGKQWRCTVVEEGRGPSVCRRATFHLPCHPSGVSLRQRCRCTRRKARVESTMTQPKQGGTKAKQIPKDVRERAWATMRRGGQIDLLKALVRRTLVKLITISS